MINILIIFFTQYFQQKNDLLLTTSPFNQRVQGSMFFPKFFCSSMNEMNEEEKKTCMQLLQARCFEEKGIC
jgi:hypothetical protein